MYFSPKTSADGLVFHYDTGNTVRSYLGEPTTNLVNPNWSPWSVDGSGQGSIGTRTLLSAYHCRIVDISANTRQYIFTEGISANTQYTFSVKFLKISGTPTLRFQIQSYNGDTFINAWFPTTVQIGIADTEGWQTAEYTVTTPANTTRILWFMQDGDDYTTYTHSFELKEPQIEAKSHATPFVAGTRSATQGLKDLTARNTVNLSNVSFDANAQMTFDGTDDTLDTGISLTALPALSNFTIECLVKIDAYPTAAPVNGYGSTTRCGVLIGAAYYSGTALYWYGNSSGTACTIYAYIRGADAYRTAGGFNLTPGRYHHLVLVNDYSGGTLKLYANGTLNGSANTATQEYNPSLAPTAGNIGISKAQVDGGGEAVYSYLPCQVPSVKIFNRALTADEVARNFNAIKSRFNIG